MSVTDAADVLEVARFATIPEAELAVSFLKQHGVRAWLPDRDMLTTNPGVLLAIGGARVVTTTAHIAEARRLIERMRAGDFADENDDNGDWLIDYTPGKVGELDNQEIQGVLGPAKKAGLVVVVIFFLILPLAGCILMVLGA